MLRFCFAAALSITVSTAGSTVALAQSLAPVDMLFRSLGLNETIEIIREEGLGYGVEMQNDLLEGRGGARWGQMVSEIYDLQEMTDLVRNRLDSELAAEDLAPMLAFFDSEIGQRIIALEISARRAFLDEAIEEASKEALADMIAQKHPRMDLIKGFTTAGDLINFNVMSALNSNYSFFVGLMERDSFPVPMTEEEIIADVWGQEEIIRNDTREWLYSYFAVAYQPLTDEEFATYIAFSQSPEGRVLNQAIFAAFDVMFTDISLSLGRAASMFLAGEEL